MFVGYFNIGIRDFIKKFEEGRYDTDDSAEIIREVRYINCELYKNNDCYKKDFHDWMRIVYELVLKITNPFILEDFYINTNCDELWNVLRDSHIRLIPYDSRLAEQYALDIHIDGCSKGIGTYYLTKRDGFICPSESNGDEKREKEETLKFKDREDLLKTLNELQRSTGTSTYHIELTFPWDDGGDTKDVLVTVPGNVTVGMINFILKKMHEELEKNGVYFEQGRNPETLLNETCRENGWTWKEPEFDLVAEFS